MSPFSKVLESVVYEELYTYFSQNYLFNPSLRGYRKHRSTQTTLRHLFDKWVRSAADGKLSGIVLLDLSTAFDLVDLSLLLEKLKLYRSHDKILDWLESYLRNRKQTVWIDNVFKDFSEVEVGVLQGSNLGPLLLLMFFNDLHFYLSCEMEAYADDSTLTTSGLTVEDISCTLTENCENVSQWMAFNRLKLNSNKTHVMT